VKLYLLSAPNGIPTSWCLADKNRAGRKIEGQLSLERHGGCCHPGGQINRLV
jgi:hypothetical protein